LLLTFPQMRTEDFLPWVEQAEAMRRGLTTEAYAAEEAHRWRDGLATWGQDGARITRFRDAVEAAIYTPASNAGLPLTVLQSFAAPPAALRQDAEAFRERVSSSASGLLALLGIDADPIRSREHILMATLLDHTWRQGRDLQVADLIRGIQSPPFDKVGFLDLETFYPSRDRFELAMQLNNLLASPAFAGWLEGESLRIDRLLYTTDGKPRLSIISLAHLSDAERMFFVTILLNEVLTWIRCQSGTSSLRAILYMDEVFGFFPPIANPPSKPPMLTLLKQARAFGLGLVLATQNPVDLDYKGLSNAGTWLLGRLQTERDKARVLDGLQGAAASTAAPFDRQQMETVLAGLGNRVFLMNNVHEDGPVVFQTRWALSYLRGPLTRDQIKTLMSARKRLESGEDQASAGTEAAEPSAAPALPAAGLERPIVPPGVRECFFPRKAVPSTMQLVYRPGLLGTARLHYVDSKSATDVWRPVALLVPAGDAATDDPWSRATKLSRGDPSLDSEPDRSAGFAELPAELSQAKNYSGWSKKLKDHLYRDHLLTIWHCPDLKAYSGSEESEADFRVRLLQLAREKRDADIEKLRSDYAPKVKSLEERIRRAEERVEQEKSQYRQQRWQTAVSFGTSLLGALMGRKLASKTNVSKAATAMRGVGRSMDQREDVGQAEEKLEDLVEQKR
ncbi:MAG: ATP-binding protein, partial [Planctomycetes bacterium]|nr:ATP-binding protein [Planctomycetota bacterium]